MRPIVLVLAAAVMSASCSTPERGSDVPATPPPSPPKAAASAPAATAPAPIRINPNDRVTGTWKLVMGATTWTVHLAPRPDAPKEHMGVGQRDALGEHGQPVTMDVGAVLEHGEFRAWLTMGVIRCAGRYRATGPITGNCQDIRGDAAGPFQAERVSP